MKRKASKPRSVEQIIRILRQADGGQTVAKICRETDLLKISIAAFETSAWTKKSSFLSPKPASSSKTIDAFIMENDLIVVWAIKRPMNSQKT